MSIAIKTRLVTALKQLLVYFINSKKQKAYYIAKLLYYYQQIIIERYIIVLRKKAYKVDLINRPFVVNYIPGLLILLVLDRTIIRIVIFIIIIFNFIILIFNLFT